MADLHEADRRARRSLRVGSGLSGAARRITTASLAMITAAAGAVVLSPAAAAAPAPRAQSGGSAPAAPAAAPAPMNVEADEDYKILVFSKTGGFRHTDGINAGKATIANLGAAHNFTADFSEDSAVFTEA